ncbi:MAG: nucleoside-diphosphate kinase [Candidatus Nanoarchaeia archaeon]
MQERTLVLIKPDGVKKALIGEVIKRFESLGLKIIALQLTNPTREQMDMHYPKDKDYITNLGNNTLRCYKEFELPSTPEEEYGTNDPYEIGLKVRGWLLDFMTSGPIVKIVVEGLHAIKTVRKITGVTIPAFAEPGSIRGDFSIDSPDYANAKKRAIKNLIHASGNREEAEHEIALWFSPEDLHEYKTIHDLMDE